MANALKMGCEYVVNNEFKIYSEIQIFAMQDISIVATIPATAKLTINIL